MLDEAAYTTTRVTRRHAIWRRLEPALRMLTCGEQAKLGDLAALAGLTVDQLAPLVRELVARQVVAIDVP